MKLRIQPSIIRRGEEPPVRRRRPYTRWIYLGLLVLALFFVVVKLADHYLYVEALGQLEIARLNVQEITDIRILNILVSEGQEVRRGDALFTFMRPGTWSLPLAPTNWGRPAPRVSGGRANRAKLKLKQLELDHVERSLAESRERAEEMRRLMLLKAGVAAEYGGASREVDRLQLQRDLLVEEMRQLAAAGGGANPVAEAAPALALDVQVRDGDGACEMEITASRPFAYRLAIGDRLLELSTGIAAPQPYLAEEALAGALVQPGRWELRPAPQGWTLVWPLARPCQVASGRELRAPFRLQLPLRPAADPPPAGRQTISLQPTAGEVFRSPFSGMVTRIYFENYEVALKGEAIMNIYTPRDLHIKAFFEQEDSKLLSIGQEVTLQFPDDTRCQGRIVRFFNATLPHPPEFQKKYEPVHRSVVADVMPIDYKLPPGLEIDRITVKVFFQRPLL